MPDFILNYTEEQMTAMSYIAVSPQEWIQNAWDNRARQAIDHLVKEHSDYQPARLSQVQKLQIVRDTKIVTAADRQAASEHELAERTSE